VSSAVDAWPGLDALPVLSWSELWRALPIFYQTWLQRHGLGARCAGTAVEMFLQDLCEGAAAVALERGAKTLTQSHLCATLPLFPCSVRGLLFHKHTFM
jgi:hypothetical protein